MAIPLSKYVCRLVVCVSQFYRLTCNYSSWRFVSDDREIGARRLSTKKRKKQIFAHEMWHNLSLYPVKLVRFFLLVMLPEFPCTKTLGCSRTDISDNFVSEPVFCSFSMFSCCNLLYAAIALFFLIYTHFSSEIFSTVVCSFLLLLSDVRTCDNLLWI